MIAFLEWIDRASTTSLIVFFLLVLFALDALRIVARGRWWR